MSKDNYDSFFQIENCLVSSEIVTEYFSCDYEKCKGCCCIIGDSGAPLEERELESLEANYPHYSDLMSHEGRKIVKQKGFFEIDSDGDIVTPLCAGGECVYTRINEDSSCRCVIEKRYFEGRGNFRKPVSCFLYPIRITKLSNGTDALNFHRWHICKDAFIKGKKEKVRVWEFLREPLIYVYGKDFYETLSQIAEIYNKD